MSTDRAQEVRRLPAGMSLDHEKKLAIMVARPGFAGTAISRATAKMIANDPRAASYDFILDTTGSDSGATQDDLQLVLTAYHKVKRTPDLKFGCYVTTDPHFSLWAAAMDHLFGDRRCLTFSTFAEAVAFLDDVRRKTPLHGG